MTITPGQGEYFGHSPDCDNDNCALAGSIEDCLGQVEICSCALRLADEAVAALPSLLDAIERLEREREEMAALADHLRFEAQSGEE